MKVLLIEDHDELRQATVAVLQQRGHEVRDVPMAQDIPEAIGRFIPDVYVVDLNLPDEDGLSLTRRLRARHPSAGIIITTARAQIGDKVLGYGSGADIYLTKPVHPLELLAGIDALGRRQQIQRPSEGALMLHPERMQLSGPAGITDLTASDVQLLSALIHAPDRSLERWQIGEIIGISQTGSGASAPMEMRITRLRKKLAAVGAPSPGIKAMHKVGYMLCCPLVLV